MVARRTETRRLQEHHPNWKANRQRDHDAGDGDNDGASQRRVRAGDGVGGGDARGAVQGRQGPGGYDKGDDGNEHNDGDD